MANDHNTAAAPDLDAPAHDSDRVPDAVHRRRLTSNAKSAANAALAYYSMLLTTPPPPGGDARSRALHELARSSTKTLVRLLVEMDKIVTPAPDQAAEQETKGTP
jgi:hypothetical protein